MKKMMQVVFAFVASICLVSTANAEVNSKLLEYAKSSHKIAGEDVTLSSQDLKRVETFLEQNEINDTQAEDIIKKADEIVAMIDNTDYTKLSKSKKQAILNKANEAAQVIGYTLDYDNSDKEITLVSEDGKTFVFPASPYLKQTGSSNILVASVSGVALVSAAAVILRKKRNA